MQSWNLGFKGICVAAAVLLLAACETPQEDAADTGAKGQAPQQTIATSQTPAKIEGPTPGSQEELDLAVGSLIYFDFDKYDLKPEARATIERWVQWLEQNPSVTVTIEGHADERGTREYNLGLGERRATSARNYLIALNVDAGRIGTISYGKERPVCATSNEACWSQNRRDHMIVN
jgi:peptidoglycan-associated lipoprotein